MAAQHIVIIGSGFAGLYSALGARRVIVTACRDEANAPRVTVISPTCELAVRPRLYEANATTLAVPLDGLFDALSIHHIAGTVEAIHGQTKTISVRQNDAVSPIAYDRLILASGSCLVRPDIPGLADHAFDIDQVETAVSLDSHLKALASHQDSSARDTFVVCGAGFTGLEIATELPCRLRDIFGAGYRPRVILLDRNAEVGSQIGPGPRPEILSVLQDLNIETLLSTTIKSINASGVTTADGTFIPTSTVIWTAGMAASPLTRQIDSARDDMGRLVVGTDLRVPGEPAVFATGDTAHVATDQDGHVALMSCQHALVLGRTSGYNAAADLLQLPLHQYSQPGYGTCLSLGPGRAVVTAGWDRQVQLTGAEAKAVKQYINTKLIYPPTAEMAFALADPAYTIPQLDLEQLASA